MDRAREFLDQLARSMHCDPALIDQAGVTVMGTPSRAESRITSGYLLGEHLVITCDPAVEAMLRGAADGVEPTLAGWREMATSAGGNLQGAGRMQLLSDTTPVEPVIPDGYTLQVSRSVEPSVLTMLERFVAVSDDDDLDEAEIYLDELDDIVHLIVGPDGEIAAYASGHPFDLAPAYSDIGVLTHADHRGKGLGAAVVQSLNKQLLADGIEPLYRCDEDNTGSVRLSESIGFVPTTQLVAYRFDV